MEQNISEYTGYEHFSFTFEFERKHDPLYWRQWMTDNWHISFYLTAIYFMAILGLKKYMEKREKLNMKKILLVWNSGLAAFSFCGMYRAIPEMVYVLWNYGFRTSVCNNNINPIMGFWGWAFAFSKAVELFETLFFILMKRQVTPLQVIHHVLALLGPWSHFKLAPSLSRWTIGINFTIHTMMYSYFAAKSAKIFVPEYIPLFITRAQIVQFCVGLYASTYTLAILLSGQHCNTTMSATILYTASYIWFLYLFVSFYVKRYAKTDEKKVD